MEIAQTVVILPSVKGLRFGERAAVLLRMLADSPETVDGYLLHMLARKCVWCMPKIQLFFPQANAEGGPGVVRGTILLNCAGGMNTKVVATFQDYHTTSRMHCITCNEGYSCIEWSEDSGKILITVAASAVQGIKLLSQL